MERTPVNRLGLCDVMDIKIILPNGRVQMASARCVCHTQEWELNGDHSRLLNSIHQS